MTKRKSHDKHTPDSDATEPAVTEPAVNGAEESNSEPEAADAGATQVTKEEYDALYDKYVRTVAEYDNYRKRSDRDFSRLVETATERLMLEILPILDNLDRATEHRKNKTTLEEYAHGIAIIEDQLRQVLAHAGLEAMKLR